MSRVHDHAPAAAVGQALDLIPATLATLTACEFVIGVDPVFAGIHRYGHATKIDMAYKDLAHCVQGFHQTHRPRSERGTKVILPSNPAYRWGTWSGIKTVIHELGHVLHYNTDPHYIAEPVSEYAKVDRMEAFAEAFLAWVMGEPVDQQTQALLDGLAA